MLGSDLCCAKHHRKNTTRRALRQHLIRCSRWIHKVGWENYKDVALEHPKHLQGKNCCRRAAM